MELTQSLLSTGATFMSRSASSRQRRPLSRTVVALDETTMGSQVCVLSGTEVVARAFHTWMLTSCVNFSHRNTRRTCSPRSLVASRLRAPRSELLAPSSSAPRRWTTPRQSSTTLSRTTPCSSGGTRETREFRMDCRRYLSIAIPATRHYINFDKRI